MTSSDDYILVVRKKPRNPTWLKKHQERLKEASKVAAEETKHLKGAERVRAMNTVIAREMKKA